MANLYRHLVLHKLELANRIIQLPRGSIRFLRRPIKPPTAFVLGSLMRCHDQRPAIAFAPDGLVHEEV